jgi:hypothetical protein
MNRYCVEGQCELDGLLAGMKALKAENKTMRAALERLVADIGAGFPRDEGLDMAEAILANSSNARKEP